MNIASSFLASLALIMSILICGNAEARTWIVAPSGGDFTMIQDALNAAEAGDTVLVQDNPSGYNEKIVFPRSGSAMDGPIVLAAFSGHSPVIDGTGVSGQSMVLIENRSFITIRGFTIRNNSGVTDGSGIRVIGSGSGIEIRDNRIHEMRGVNAMGITVYGTSTAASISDIVIDGNEILDCDPAPSEALVLNGNVELFEVTNNHVHDVNNIGIDFIGGETSINPIHVARNGVCRGNRIHRANSIYGGGWGAGIYVDGGRDILIEGNEVADCDLGIEGGAENSGFDATGIMVRNNVVHHNDKVGIVFGGYAVNAGRTRLCEFVNNTCFENDTSGQYLGELWIQWASDNVVRNNIFYTTHQNVGLYSENGNVNNTVDFNLWFSPGGPNNTEWVWRRTSYNSFSAFRNGSGQESNGQFADPFFVDAGALDFSIVSASLAIDAGDPSDMPDSLDAAGFPRLLDGDLDGTLAVDAGAREFDHVILGVSGSFTPGGTITVDLAGTAGMPAWLLAGLSGSSFHPPFGWVSVNLSTAHLQKPYGPLPASLQETIPSNLAPDTGLVLQAAALGGGGGNLSNPVTIVVE